MRYSDRPITKPGQDVLGRAGFALELAHAIDQLSAAKDGFVISILGEWGSGKTSIVELIVRYLRHIEMERASRAPILDDDQPVPKSLDQLEEMTEISDQIEGEIVALESTNKNLTYRERLNRQAQFRRWLGSDDAAEIADRYWRIRAKISQKPRTLVVRFSPWLIAGRAELAWALLSDLGRALGEKLGADVKQAFAAVIERLSELAPIAGVGFDLVTGGAVGRLFSTGGEWSGKMAKKMASGPTLDELRQQLRNILGGLDGQQVLVIVDDLDRLTPPEALEMISLVKTLGDLPNVIYLLSYDELKLVELLEKIAGINGYEFLQKIVQYSVHLPPAAGEDLVRLLDADLTALLGTLSDEDRRRLGVTWYFIFQYYLKTPRDIRRFINSVSLALSALADHSDPIDIVLLELMRLYEPSVYWWLRRNLHDVTE
jgi:predicted KAP-like P-loop ATPase